MLGALGMLGLWRTGRDVVGGCKATQGAGLPPPLAARAPRIRIRMKGSADRRSRLVEGRALRLKSGSGRRSLRAIFGSAQNSKINGDGGK